MFALRVPALNLMSTFYWNTEAYWNTVNVYTSHVL